jgi:hypothetical protein
VTYPLGTMNPEGQYGEIGRCSKVVWMRGGGLYELDATKETF